MRGRGVYVLSIGVFMGCYRCSGVTFAILHVGTVIKCNTCFWAGCFRVLQQLKICTFGIGLFNILHQMQADAAHHTAVDALGYGGFSAAGLDQAGAF